MKSVSALRSATPLHRRAGMHYLKKIHMRYSLWLGFVRLVCMIGATTPLKSAEANSPAERLLSESRPLVIAHRGYSMLAPENTIPAFEYALTAGADMVELDYHHSKDGMPVVMHDYDLDRTTDADEQSGRKKIRVDSMLAADLHPFDAGKWFNPSFAGTRIPLLTEALDTIQQRGVTLIERKAGDAATCVQLLKERDLINKVVVQAFDWNYLKDFHALEPRQVLGALGPPSTYNGVKLSDAEKALSPKWNQIVKESGARAIVWNKQVSKEAVDDAHRQGLKVWAYTIDDERLANTMLDARVDGIITDNPSLIFRAIALRFSGNSQPKL
jgi:glycerophosphoryl diester phosphodiesterase